MAKPLGGAIVPAAVGTLDSGMASSFAAATPPAMATAHPSSPAPAPAQTLLAAELAHVARLQAERDANPILAGALHRLATWQSRRLKLTYDDLAAQERYADAIQFFQGDLYGSADFAQRDADLARVVPLMVRMLPESVIATIAKAVELHALSQTLDRSLLARLPRADGQFSVSEYCRAYRRMGKRPERERQIRLIGEIGMRLAGFVQKPWIRGRSASCANRRAWPGTPRCTTSSSAVSPPSRGWATRRSSLRRSTHASAR